MVTVEAAYAIAAMVAVIVLGVGAVVGVSVQIRCTDAAREAARLAAAGDPAARDTAIRIAGSSARVAVSDDGLRVQVEVRATMPLLPAVAVSARAVAMKEPAADGEPESMASSDPAPP
ncbi:TadE family type IV pilus minor pilin [Gordonia sp. CPCC 205515]|uniref:TadE family type IV pilus minor pilin n=1 Tax=Gordonia sp. CPCC 205515 TaxID=3140791 RepID=UPI003AF3559A